MADNLTEAQKKLIATLDKNLALIKENVDRTGARFKEGDQEITPSVYVQRAIAVAKKGDFAIASSMFLDLSEKLVEGAGGDQQADTAFKGLPRIIKMRAMQLMQQAEIQEQSYPKEKLNSYLWLGPKAKDTASKIEKKEFRIDGVPEGLANDFKQYLDDAETLASDGKHAAAAMKIARLEKALNDLEEPAFAASEETRKLVETLRSQMFHHAGDVENQRNKNPANILFINPDPRKEAIPAKTATPMTEAPAAEPEAKPVAPAGPSKNERATVANGLSPNFLKLKAATEILEKLIDPAPKIFAGDSEKSLGNAVGYAEDRVKKTDKIAFEASAGVIENVGKKIFGLTRQPETQNRKLNDELNEKYKAAFAKAFDGKNREKIAPYSDIPKLIDQYKELRNTLKEHHQAFFPPLAKPEKLVTDTNTKLNTNRPAGKNKNEPAEGGLLAIATKYDEQHQTNVKLHVKNAQEYAEGESFAMAAREYAMGYKTMKEKNPNGALIFLSAAAPLINQAVKAEIAQKDKIDREPADEPTLKGCGDAAKEFFLQFPGTEAVGPLSDAGYHAQAAQGVSQINARTGNRAVEFLYEMIMRAGDVEQNRRNRFGLKIQKEALEAVVFNPNEAATLSTKLTSNIQGALERLTGKLDRNA